MNKKLKVFLTLLLIANLILNLLAPEISKISFVGIWVTAMAFWGIVCIQENTIHTMEKIIKVDRDIVRNLMGISNALQKRIDHLEERCNLGINKINALLKIPSATGQIYVNFDEVSKILDGNDIVER